MSIFVTNIASVNTVTRSYYDRSCPFIMASVVDSHDALLVKTLRYVTTNAYLKYMRASTEITSQGEVLVECVPEATTTPPVTWSLQNIIICHED